MLQVVCQHAGLVFVGEQFFLLSLEHLLQLLQNLHIVVADSLSFGSLGEGEGFLGSLHSQAKIRLLLAGSHSDNLEIFLILDLKSADLCTELFNLIHVLFLHRGDVHTFRLDTIGATHRHFQKVFVPSLRHLTVGCPFVFLETACVGFLLAEVYVGKLRLQEANIDFVVL